ncbi:hypothetical protein DEU56DRAFT_753532 [Suillus clintonianus]|uniref:uncharacterized protein n=1 Tax=Suillus clintonianus TaxID=1904413 RepID=UPI001B8702A9|nr:uncharacterized protein DEU56DRAFT_753532 [Suillus clintonianus]KAG2146623.1 hypothetical protein DEU56DRAFT_753532 [Suillus clintonianus]
MISRSSSLILIHPEAIIITLYDVNCVLSQSLSQYVGWVIAATMSLCMHMATSGHMGRELKDYDQAPEILGLIDRQAGAIGLEINCGIKAQDLQEQWVDQKKSQLSIHAHKSKELDIILALQADLDASDRELQLTCTVVEKGLATKETLDALESLERSCDFQNYKALV